MPFLYWFMLDIYRSKLNSILSAAFNANSIKASKFLFDAAKKNFFSFPVFCCHFSLQLKISFLLQIPSRGICVLSRPYFTQNTVPQIYHSPILAEAFPLNLTIFHTILSLSHPENYYVVLFFLLFFVTNCITNCLKK